FQQYQNHAISHIEYLLDEGFWHEISERLHPDRNDDRGDRYRDTGGNCPARLPGLCAQGAPGRCPGFTDVYPEPSGKVAGEQPGLWLPGKYRLHRYYFGGWLLQ